MNEARETPVRAFVAVPVAEAAARELERLITRLRSLAAGGPRLRWASRDQLHVTLRFLGEQPPEAIDRIRDALAPIRFAPFDIELTRAGAFPGPGPDRPRTLWLGGERGAAELTDLARQVEDALAGAGIPREGRPFRPHLTLARGNGASLPEPLREALKKIPALRWRCEGFALMRSRLTPGGAVYTKLYNYSTIGTTYD